MVGAIVREIALCVPRNDVIIDLYIKNSSSSFSVTNLASINEETRSSSIGHSIYALFSLW